MTADLVLSNVEFKPDYGFEKQKKWFGDILREEFTSSTSVGGENQIHNDNDSSSNSSYNNSSRANTAKLPLSLFLEFSLSLSTLPLSGHLPDGQKLAVRFVNGEDTDKLPVSHTCMFSLDVPVYESKGVFSEKLRRAVELGCCGFGIS